MKPDVNLATETMIKYTIYLNIIFLISSFLFIENFKSFSIIITISNMLFLSLRQSIKKNTDNINARSKR